jgi:hypothetical protein
VSVRAWPVRLWLPALSRFVPTHPLRRLARQADRLEDGAQGYVAALAQNFGLLADALPAAALTRQWYAGDAGDALWLAADPAWVQPDMNGARLLACGQWQLSMDDAQSLAAAVRPAVEEAGMQLLVSAPDRWQLRLPEGLALPTFAAPEQALGEDLFQHLPQGEPGRTWRRLINEAQVLLHQHPLNTRRREQGLPPINSLWLWGGGRLPAVLDTPWHGVISDEPVLCALAEKARIPTQSRSPDAVAKVAAGWLIDLQDLPVDTIAAHFETSIQQLAASCALELAFASGERYLHKRWHRLRRWRRGGV